LLFLVLYVVLLQQRFESVNVTNYYDVTRFYKRLKWDLLEKPHALLGPFTPSVIKCIEPTDAGHSAEGKGCKDIRGGAHTVLSHCSATLPTDAARRPPPPGSLTELHLTSVWIICYPLHPSNPPCTHTFPKSSFYRYITLILLYTCLPP